MMENSTTLLDTLNGLSRDGYVEDFNLNKNCIECRNGAFKIFHDEFVVDKYYRFDDMSDPGEEAIVYAISSPKYKLKGTLINSYGTYYDSITSEMAEKLKINK